MNKNMLNKNSIMENVLYSFKVQLFTIFKQTQKYIRQINKYIL